MVTDLDSKDKRAEDGMPNPSMAKSLEKLGQGYWPFIMLFEPGFKTAISSFLLVKLTRILAPICFL